jgi:hypothetical protein
LDEGAGKVDKPQVVGGLLFPADKQPTKAMHPTVKALDDPAAGAVARQLGDSVGFFATGADVGGKPKVAKQSRTA